MVIQTYSGGFPVQHEHKRGHMFDNEQLQSPFRGLNWIRSSKSGPGSSQDIPASLEGCSSYSNGPPQSFQNNHLDTDPRDQEAQLPEDEPRWVRRPVDRRGPVKMEETTHKTHQL